MLIIRFKSPGYALVGLMTGYSFEVGKSKITAQLNIDNLLDKTYFTNVAPAFDEFSLCQLQHPAYVYGVD